MFSETERSPLEGVSLSEKGLERAERGGRVLSHLPWGGVLSPTQGLWTKRAPRPRHPPWEPPSDLPLRDTHQDRDPLLTSDTHAQQNWGIFSTSHSDFKRC